MAKKATPLPSSSAASSSTLPQPAVASHHLASTPYVQPPPPPQNAHMHTPMSSALMYPSFDDLPLPHVSSAPPVFAHVDLPPGALAEYRGPAVELSSLSNTALRKLVRAFYGKSDGGSTAPNHRAGAQTKHQSMINEATASRDELLREVQRCYAQWEVRETDVIAWFIYSIRNKDNFLRVQTPMSQKRELFPSQPRAGAPNPPEKVISPTDPSLEHAYYQQHPPYPHARPPPLQHTDYPPDAFPQDPQPSTKVNAPPQPTQQQQQQQQQPPVHHGHPHEMYGYPSNHGDPRHMQHAGEYAPPRFAEAGEHGQPPQGDPSSGANYGGYYNDGMYPYHHQQQQQQQQHEQYYAVHRQQQEEADAMARGQHHGGFPPPSAGPPYYTTQNPGNPS